jgi:dienelactone hydrolase
MPALRRGARRQKWLDILASLEAGTLFIGGKSMGGRIASLIADEARVTGLICLGYPFHTMNKPAQLRVERLQAIRTPTLILQGERDPFGSPGEVSRYPLSSQIRLRWLPAGDHRFQPEKNHPGARRRRTGGRQSTAISGARPDDPARRHGRVLRVGRGTGPPRTAWQARHRRRHARRPRRRGGGQLRGSPVWRP